MHNSTYCNSSAGEAEPDQSQIPWPVKLAYLVSPRPVGDHVSKNKVDGTVGITTKADIWTLNKYEYTCMRVD